jgi:hypothetical protein
MSPEDKPIQAAGGTRKEIKHKVFISCSQQDREYRDRFEELFGRLFTIKSVAEGEMGTDDAAAYIEQLIQRELISVVTVVVVLVGADTWSRRHVDWEIAAALRKKLDGFSGLLGLCLPTHPDYQKRQYKKDIVPLRLSDNIQSGYAAFHDWSEGESDIKRWIEDAFRARVSREDMIDDSRPLFTNTWLEHSKWPPPPPAAEVAAAEPAGEVPPEASPETATEPVVEAPEPAEAEKKDKKAKKEKKPKK